MSITINTFYRNYRVLVQSNIASAKKSIIEHDDKISYLMARLLEEDPIFHKYLQQYADGKYTEKDIKDGWKTSSSLGRVYIDALIRNIKAVRELYSKITTYRTYLKIDVKNFDHLLHAVNFAISKSVLQGHTFNFNNYIGDISVVVKTRNTNNDYATKVVDWEESVRVLMQIGEEVNDETRDLVNQYKTKNISQRDFIKLMKPYTYSVDTPNQPQWLMYFIDDNTTWFNWVKKYCQLKNKKVYAFRPTQFINVSIDGQRSKKKVSEVWSKDQILDTYKLGNQDKMHCLRRKDSSHFTKTI